MTGTVRVGSRTTTPRLGLPLGLAMFLHGSLVVVVLGGQADRVALPPIYRVELIAAPRAVERAVGAVTETPPAPSAPAAPPKRAESNPKDVISMKKAAPTRKAPAKATPTPDARSARRDAPAAKAAGGPEGGKGADVVSIKTEGMEFPDPTYLQNIVRQIALRFRPKDAGLLHAEVVFLIRRDGSVFNAKIRVSSGSYAFNVDALGAIEAAAAAKAFGPLPNVWADDVLTVIFTFDAKLIR